jgi:hypothetical protein
MGHPTAPNTTPLQRSGGVKQVHPLLLLLFLPSTLLCPLLMVFLRLQLKAQGGVDSHHTPEGEGNKQGLTQQGVNSGRKCSPSSK